jgi:pantetheine-phosphate adenylyltransferase
MKKTRAVYPGSFDPLHLGHVDIIRRISKLYDEVTVLISKTPSKSYLFSDEERINLVTESLKTMTNVSVDLYQGLTIDYLKQHNSKVIVRGLRAVVDFEYEMAMASMNKKMDSEIETVLVFASPEYYYISSRGIKEIAKFGGKLEGMLPSCVIPELQQKMR